MPHRTFTYPKPIQSLIQRALALAQISLKFSDRLYPFAAIFEAGQIGCLFTDETHQHSHNNQQMIEHLQWRIIDNTADSYAYSLLAYHAEVEVSSGKKVDAIAVTITGPERKEEMLVYPYYRLDGQVVLSPPITEQ